MRGGTCGQTRAKRMRTYFKARHNSQTKPSSQQAPIQLLRQLSALAGVPPPDGVRPRLRLGACSDWEPAQTRRTLDTGLTVSTILVWLTVWRKG